MIDVKWWLLSKGGDPYGDQEIDQSSVNFLVVIESN